jgi:hypothetical protein
MWFWQGEVPFLTAHERHWHLIYSDNVGTGIFPFIASYTFFSSDNQYRKSISKVSVCLSLSLSLSLSLHYVAKSVTGNTSVSTCKNTNVGKLAQIWITQQLFRYCVAFLDNGRDVWKSRKEKGLWTGQMGGQCPLKVWRGNALMVHGSGRGNETASRLLITSVQGGPILESSTGLDISGWMLILERNEAST